MSKFGAVALMAACLSLGGWLASTQVEAATYTVDTKIGEALLGNSGTATEASALASILGVDVSTLALIESNTSPAAALDDAGNWFLDVNPDTPGWFMLKFGIGGTSATADHFFFQNIAELTKLVWTDSLVQGLTGGCNNCNIERLSHYNTYNPTAIPLPGGLLLFLTGLGGVGFMGRLRSKRQHAMA